MSTSLPYADNGAISEPNLSRLLDPETYVIHV